MDARKTCVGEGLRDALAFSIFEKLLKDRPSRELAMGNYLIERGQLSAAELCFEQAIREAQEKQTTAAALIGKSEIFRRRKEFAEANRALNSAHKIAEEIGDPKLSGLVYQQEAEIASAENLPALALEKLEATQAAFSRSEDATLERTQVFLKMGLTCQELVHLRQALVYYEQAERLAQDVTKDKAKGSLFRLLAVVGQANALAGLGKADDALHRCTQAEELLDPQAQNAAELGKMIVELKAACHEALGDLRKAARSYEQALAGADDISSKAKICAQLAVTEFSLGLPDEARKHEEEALAVLDHEVVPEALLNLSQLNLMRGQIRIAETQYVRAVIELSGNRDKPDARQEIGLKLHQASLDLQSGMFLSARDRVSAVYEELLAKRDGDTEVEVEALLPSVLCSMANFARLQGQLDEAQRCYQEALDIAERLDMRLTVAAALGGLAQVASARPETPAAFEYLARAIDITKNCGAELHLQSLLVDRTVLSNRVGKLSPEETRALLEDLLRQSVRVEALPLELQIRVALGMMHQLESRFAEAREHLDEAIDRAGKAGLEFAKIIAQGILGTILSDAGEQQLAEQYLSDALTAMEQRGLEIEAKQEFRERYRDLTGFSS